MDLFIANYLHIVLAVSSVYLLHRLRRIVKRVTGSSISRVPGPWYSKWTRVVIDYHFLRGTRSLYIHDLHAQYGPIVRIAPDEVNVTDIDAVKTIYSVKDTFLKSGFYRRIVPPESIFSTANIDFHRRHRRLLAGPLTETSLKKMIPAIRTISDLVVQRMGEEMKVRGAADVFKWATFMATDTIAQLTFGDSFHMVELGRKTEYALELQNVSSVAALRSTFPGLTRLAFKLPFQLPIFQRAVKGSSNIKRYCTESLDRYRQLLDADPGMAHKTLLAKAFEAEQEDNLPFHEVIADAQTYIVAGSGSTANTLAFLIWAVCRNPYIRDRLVKELASLPPDYQESQLRELPYLGQVVEETLRLYGGAQAGLPRTVPPGGAELAGFCLDQGTVVSTQAYSLHRDAIIFPDPFVFDPSRWENPTQAMKDAFMPFGRGSRSCIGLHLAQIEIRLAAARFFLTFPEAKPSSLEGMSDQDMVPAIYFTTVPAGNRCLIQAA
ncbi:cytochrome P450 [Metarhizium robertsii]|uniref:Cytochrome P450 n=1 Tax=Metarhizium robertsii TaxID=568076 RepID=A0A014P9L0_9HYPO|nr:cytochrome P450 [Metarhizium robertsii]